MRKILFAVLCLHIFAITVSAQYAQLAVSNIPSSLTEGADAVVRQDDTVVLIEEDKVTYTFTYAETVLDASDEQRLTFSVSYQEGVEKVEDIRIVIVDANGEIVKKVKNKEVKKTNAYTSTLISNRQILSYTHNTTRYPCTIYYSYTKVDKSPTHINRWIPIKMYDTAVESSTYTVRNLTSVPSPLVSTNMTGYNISQDGDNSFSMTNQPAVISEKYSPHYTEILPIVTCRLQHIKYFDLECEASSWQELSKWIYASMYVPQQTCKREDLLADVAVHVGNEEDPLHIAATLYRYIQDNFRYVFIGLDDAGYIPLDTKKVHEQQYGDCKALSWYYQTLLELYDIKSDLVLVNSGATAQPLVQDFVTPVAFDHVINRLTIDGKEYWVDCTSTSKPFGYLGSFSDDRQGLVIESAGGTLTLTPKYPHEVAYQVQTVLSVDGDIAGTLEIVNIGAAMDQKLLSLPGYTDKQYQEYLEDYLLKKYQGCEVTAKSYELDTSTLALTERYTFAAPREVELLGDYLLIDGNQLSLAVPKLTKDKNRIFPVYFHRDKKVSITEYMTIPAGARLSPMPDIVMESDYGSYHHKVTYEEDQIKIDRVLIVNAGTYPATNYDSVKAFFDKIRKAERRQITINTKS